MREDVVPKNILMIGPTGVGKTEIARRLSTLAGAPFVKVEATKFTEVGYVGRDVDAMVRDLVEAAISMIEKEQLESVQERAEERVGERLLDLLVEKPTPPQPRGANPFSQMFGGTVDDEPARSSQSQSSAYQAQVEQAERLRGRMKEKLERGELENAEVEIEVEEKRSNNAMFFSPGGEEMGGDMQNMLGNLFPANTKTRRVKIKEARKIIKDQEAQKLIDRDEVITQAIERVEQNGILFIDEIDKVAGREGSGGSGPQVSREGVQRDILPLGRRLERQHQTRHGAHRSYSVHRRGRVSRFQTQRFNSRIARPLPDSRRAGTLDRRRFSSHLDRTAPRTNQTIRRTAGHRRSEFGLDRRWHRRNRAFGAASERQHRRHRRAPFAHDGRTFARSDCV